MQMLPSQIDFFHMFTMFLLFILLKIPIFILYDRLSTPNEWNYNYSVNNFEGIKEYSNSMCGEDQGYDAAFQNDAKFVFM